MSENIPVGPNCMPEMPKTLPVLEDPQDNCDHGVPEHTVCSDCLFERIKALEDQVKIVQDLEDERSTELFKLFKWAEARYPDMEYNQYFGQQNKAVKSAGELIRRVVEKDALHNEEMEKYANRCGELEALLHKAGVDAGYKAQTAMKFVADLQESLAVNARLPVLDFS